MAGQTGDEEEEEGGRGGTCERGGGREGQEVGKRRWEGR